jgi:hypothetical protein
VWLTNAKNEDWTVMDVGVLAAILLAFANRDASIITDARVEEENGEPVLVIAGGVGSELRFTRGIGGSPVSDPESAGFVRLRPALSTLVRNGWLELEVAVGETRIRRGERAKAMRELVKEPRTAFPASGSVDEHEHRGATGLGPARLAFGEALRRPRPNSSPRVPLRIEERELEGGGLN